MPHPPTAPAGGAPHPRRAAVGRRIGWALFRSLYSVAVLHPARVPDDGAAILVSNHLGFLDGPLVFGVAPRPVTFLVKRELFRGIPGRVLTGVGQLPIDRERGDRQALTTARAVLARGDLVGVFPEGRRGRGDVAEVQQGAAWLALQSRAPVIPVACLGTRAHGHGASSLPRPRARMAVVFGEPFGIAPAPGVPGRDRLRQASDLLRERLGAHVHAAAQEVDIRLPDMAEAVRDTERPD